MSSGLLDLLLVLLLGAYAVGGFRQGLLTSLLSIIGFFLGGALGLWLVPKVLLSWPALTQDSRLSAAVAVLFIFLLASVGQAIGISLGTPLRSGLVGRTSRGIDSALGAVALVMATGLFIWLGAGLVRPVSPPVIAKAMGQSRVLAVIDAVVPPSTSTVAAGVESLLDRGGFPRVFEGLQAEPITPVEPPPSGIGATAPVRAAAASIVKITGTSLACAQAQEGSGWVLADQRVVTNAHVVAGLSQVTVRVGGRGMGVMGTVVVFDPERDLAVIDVPDLHAPALDQAGTGAAGQAGAVAGFPLDGPYAVVPARIRSQLSATGADIYGNSGIKRQIYSLYATVKPGNSGGPLLDAQGRVLGVVFARSLDDANTGYALTLAEARPVLQEGLIASTPVATGRCITDVG
ncbi:MAG: MarP family serine protease [Nostocoides sp.]